MLVTSRSFDEYIAMFDLGSDDLSGRVLDCSAGVAGFVVEANRRPGCRAVAVDPVYSLPRDELAQLGNADLQRGSAIAGEFTDRFTFAWYGAPERRTALRTHALADFLLDLVMHPNRYVAGQLPHLPFRDGSFDLALCSHLLFTWADQLGLAWHVAALREMVRVATQVRIFPTLMQGRGDAVPFWDDLMSELAVMELRADMHRVPYEFQTGGDTMLVVTGANG